MGEKDQGSKEAEREAGIAPVSAPFPVIRVIRVIRGFFNLLPRERLLIAIAVQSASDDFLGNRNHLRLEISVIPVDVVVPIRGIKAEADNIEADLQLV